MADVLENQVLLQLNSRCYSDPNHRVYFLEAVATFENLLATDNTIIHTFISIAPEPKTWKIMATLNRKVHDDDGLDGQLQQTLDKYLLLWDDRPISYEHKFNKNFYGTIG